LILLVAFSVVVSFPQSTAITFDAQTCDSQAQDSQTKVPQIAPELDSQACDPQALDSQTKLLQIGIPVESHPPLMAKSSSTDKLSSC